MTATSTPYVAPSPQQLLKAPARFTDTVLPTPATLTELVDCINAADDDVKRSIIGELLGYAPTAAMKRLTTAATQSVNQQLAALQWNRLPNNVVISILSYLPTKQTVLLRRVSSTWNELGQLTSSFNTSTAKGSILEIEERDSYSLAGVQAVAVHVAVDSVQNWSDYDGWTADRRKLHVQKAYKKLLKCLLRCQGSSITTLVSTRVTELPDQQTDYPCQLTTLCKLAIVDQLQCLHFHIHGHDEDWKVLASAKPLTQLIEFHGRMCQADEVPRWPTLCRLMPNLVTISLTFADTALTNLQPILQLPNLTQFAINTVHRLDQHTAAPSIAKGLVGATAPACKLLHLQLAADENFQRLLVADRQVGLRSFATHVTQLSLYNVEHRDHCATHLAKLQHLVSLELISTSSVPPTKSDYRQRLLHALNSLPQLRILSLLVEDWTTSNTGSLQVEWDHQDYRHSDDEDAGGAMREYFMDKDMPAWWDEQFPDSYVKYCPWSAEDLRVLFRLPLEDLSVQCLAPTAGRAMSELAAADSVTLRRLKLGVTNLNWEDVVAVADKLQTLRLPAVASPRDASSCNKRVKNTPLPSNVSYYAKWTNRLI